MKKGKSDTKANKSGAMIFARNRRARFDYQIVESLECGLMLSGWEVKSIRAGKANLSGAYVNFRNGEAFLLGMQVTPLESTDNSAGDIDPERTRKLLMNKSQLRKLARSVQSGNYSCVPLELYQGTSSYLKVLIALGQGRKKVDKRERIKQREWERTQAKALKRTTRPS